MFIRTIWELWPEYNILLVGGIMFEHGECDVTSIDSIIVVTLKGSFNDIAVEACIGKIKSEIEIQKLDRFSMLIDYSESIGGTPDAYAISNQFNSWLNSEDKLNKKALVTKIEILVDISLKQQSELRKQDVKIFSNTDDALKWLRA